MKIKWLKDVTITCVESYDEKNGMVDETDESFVKDEVTEFDIFDDRGITVNIQFGDGSVAYGVPKSIYEVIEKD